jgi:hypothetical protein
MNRCRYSWIWQIYCERFGYQTQVQAHIRINNEILRFQGFLTLTNHASAMTDRWSHAGLDFREGFAASNAYATETTCGSIIHLDRLIRHVQKVGCCFIEGHFLFEFNIFTYLHTFFLPDCCRTISTFSCLFETT